MTVKEMMDLNEKYFQITVCIEQLHTWTKYKLAERYKQPAPKMIPAHWLGNRWSQAWPGIVEGVNLDPLCQESDPRMDH